MFVSSALANVVHYSIKVDAWNESSRLEAKSVLVINGPDQLEDREQQGYKWYL